MAARLRALLGIVVAMLATPGIAGAQSQFDVLHSFAPKAGTINPRASLIQATDGNFYGTTSGGVSGLGTVFRMTPSGAVTVLHAFTGRPTDGANPMAALVEAADGSFYGTTSAGGASNNGTVFQVTPSGTVTILHSFTGGTDGASPQAALVQASDGDFYGTTQSGGISNGTVFRMTPTGTVTGLHSFADPLTGHPYAPLVQAADGNFYGTTSGGGRGTVFRMTPSGVFTVLHAFTGGTDGASPQAALVQATDGNLYGTSTGSQFNGTVFQITLSGVFTVLHAFTGGADGASPRASLIQATDGTFYGTTSSGGTLGSGTVFQMTPSGTVTTLHAFAGGSDGASPYAAVILASDGNFYGTTFSGGPSNLGTVFQMIPSGTVTVLYAFVGSIDGAAPVSALVQGTDGNFYGTTSSGGTANGGTVFQMTPSGTVTVLHPFRGGTDGASPHASLIQGTDGNFYGTTSAGGTADNGTVFRMTPNGSVTVLSGRAFAGVEAGRLPEAALIQATDGNFYGTTYTGTAYLYGPVGYMPCEIHFMCGTVFQMTPSGAVTWLPFLGQGFADGTFGNHLTAALIQATDGQLYGTASAGGGDVTDGTIFRTIPDGHGGFVREVLHRFNGGADGAFPLAALIQATDGNFYGTTCSGGTSNVGTVFQMTPSGVVAILHTFTGNDGACPLAALIQTPGGNFYGTTSSGGTSNAGTVFQMTPSGSVTVLHAFTGGTDGAVPRGPLIQGTDGNLYGTTSAGGASGTGVVFRLMLPPTATTLISPHGTIPTNLPSYAWQNVGTATAYYLRVNNSSGAPVIQAQYGAASCAATVCVVTPALPLPLDMYTWSVQTWNSVGYGPASTPLTFTVGLSKKRNDDFDGDGKADIAVYRPSNGVWYVLQSRTNYATYTGYQWGVSTDIPVRGDYDGDGQTDIAVFRPATGSWYVLLSRTNFTTWVSYQWGVSTDTPVPGDYDGDGKADIAIYRPATGSWYVLLSTTNSTSYVSYQWGVGTDLPLARDYDGDGRVDIAVYRPATGAWYVLLSSTNFATFISYQFGVSTDVPVPADYDGDGKADIAVYRPATGVWYILLSSTNQATPVAYQWGVSTDTPVPADYDGDGETDIAVYRPASGTWYVLLSTTNYHSYVSYQWGISTDVP